MARCDYTRRNLTGRNKRAEAERTRQLQMIAEEGGRYVYMKKHRLARENKQRMEARHDDKIDADAGYS